MTIACHLVKEAKRSELLGDSAESRAVVQQWLEYRVTRLDSYTKEDIKTILKVGRKSFTLKLFYILILMSSTSLRSQFLLQCHL